MLALCTYKNTTNHMIFHPITGMEWEIYLYWADKKDSSNDKTMSCHMKESYHMQAGSM